MAVLSIFSQADTYIFSLAFPTESPLYPQQTIHAPFTVGGQIELNLSLREQLHQAITDAVTQQRMRNVGPDAARSLERLGRLMFNFIVPPALQTALRDLPSEWPIILTTNDTKLPWELLHDGTQYLALKHSVGRHLWSTAPVRQQTMPNKINRLFLFISNPTGDLNEADLETNELMDIFDSEVIAGAYPTLLARSRASKWNVLEALAEPSDLIHYSGHAEPGTLLLSDGQLTTGEIEKTLSGRPFVFLNACSSVRQAKQSDVSAILSYPALTVESLAKAFIMGGAVGFIGTLWPVFDHSSREFAELFYTHVLDGIPVGEALRRTRVQMREQEPDDPIWASFVHYGNPQLTLAKAPPEKRYVTVLVAKLPGLALLVEGLPLEASVRLKEQVLGRLKGIVERYEGWLTGPVTDVLAVYFGIPLMTGNEAEVAIRAARDMSQAWRDFYKANRLARDKREELSLLTLQIGISTGYVLYRAPQGEGTDKQIRGVLEEMAAAGATQAKNGQIVVDQATYQSARTTFSFERVESTPKPRYRVMGINLPQRSEFVGRAEELSQLEGFWRKARRGRRQVISIGGEAGVGKSRLLEAFREQLTGEHRWISAICHSYDKSQSYHLLGQVIRALAQIEPHHNEATQRRKLGQLVEGEDDLALLSTVLGLRFEMPAIQNLTQDLAQKLLKKLLERILKRQAASQPMVLALEDLQSADEDSLTVLEQLVKGRDRRMALLLLAVYRLNEWEHKWGNAVQANIELDELPSKAQLTMLTNLLNLPPSEELAQILLKQTGGNPLFIEEYIRFLQESDLLTRSDDNWTANASIKVSFASRKIEPVIQARLGRLDDQSRQTLHSAAIIGQTFEDQVLYKVREKKTDYLDEEEIIEELTHQRLIEELEEGHDNILFYSFRHGLVHQIALTLFPDSFLQTIHRLVAEALQIVYSDEKKILSRLAHHYYHSHDRVNAIRYCLRAAKKDAQRWANQGAIQWYKWALEKMESFEELPATEREEDNGATPTQLIEWHVEALEGKADVQRAIGHNDEAIASYQQALTLVTDIFSVTRHADLYRKLAISHHDKGEFDTAQKFLNEGLKALNGLECLEAGRIHVYIGLIHFRRGQLLESLTSCKQGVAIIEKTESIRDLAQAYNLLGIIHHNMGKNRDALSAYNYSIGLYKQIQYLQGLERAYSNVGSVYQDLGKWNKALHYFQQSIQISDRTGEERSQVGATINLGELYRRQGKLDQAIKEYQSVEEDAKAFPELIGIVLMNLGASYLQKGEITKAEEHLTQSLDIYQRIQVNIYLSELLRYLAELHLMNGEPIQALKLAQQALERALKLNQRLEEGQSLRTVGQVYRKLGHFEQADAFLRQSLKILEEHNSLDQVALTLVELALLRKVQSDAVDQNSDMLRTQGVTYCDRAIAIFEALGAALDLKRAQEVRLSLLGGARESTYAREALQPLSLRLSSL